MSGPEPSIAGLHGDDGLVLHSSWRGLVAAMFSAVAMSLLTAVAWGGGATVVSVALTVVSAAIVLIVAFDYPVAAVFTSEGVTRRCLLRREHLAWDRIDALTRAADAPGSETTHGGVRATGRRVLRGRPAGLVAAVGRRRYLLVNQCESRTESDALRELLAVWDPATRWRAGRPEDHLPPTWLYRRRQWRP